MRLLQIGQLCSTQVKVVVQVHATCETYSWHTAGAVQPAAKRQQAKRNAGHFTLEPVGEHTILTVNAASKLTAHYVHNSCVVALP